MPVKIIPPFRGTRDFSAGGGKNSPQKRGSPFLKTPGATAAKIWGRNPRRRGRKDPLSLEKNGVNSYKRGR